LKKRKLLICILARRPKKEKVAAELEPKASKGTLASEVFVC
jgi:hypothetical protein